MHFLPSRCNINNNIKGRKCNGKISVLSLSKLQANENFPCKHGKYYMALNRCPYFLHNHILHLFSLRKIKLTEASDWFHTPGKKILGRNQIHGIWWEAFIRMSTQIKLKKNHLSLYLYRADPAILKSVSQIPVQNSQALVWLWCTAGTSNLQPFLPSDWGTKTH